VKTKKKKKKKKNRGKKERTAWSDNEQLDYSFVATVSFQQQWVSYEMKTHHVTFLSNEAVSTY